jgi:hypothetical protein
VAVGRLKALVCVSGFAYHHALQALVVELLAAGQLVLVALDHQPGGPAPEDRQALDDLRERNSGFDYRRLRPRVGMWRTLAGATSRTLDYLYLLEPANGGAESRCERAREAAPRVTRVLLPVLPFRWTFGRRALTRALCGVEAGIPAPRGVRAVLSEQTPDLVVVAPSAAFSSGHGDWIRSAEAAGIPWAAVFETEEELAYARGLPRGHAVVVADGVNGTGALGGADTLEAVERAARAPVETGQRGRIARPLLWLLSPFIALALVLCRPRASARALVKAMRRVSARARKRARARRRQRDQRAKARARAQKAERAARAEAAREEKAKRARLKAEAERLQTAESQASAGSSNTPSQPRG